MSGYVTLMGAEDVARAGSRMAEAADGMRNAAGTIDNAVLILVRAMDEHAARVEAAAERIERALAARAAT